MGVASEIADLRAVEAEVQRVNERHGRLQNRLLQAHPGNLLVVGYLPPGTWAELPEGWQGHLAFRLTPRIGLPPRGVKGSVAVSECVAEWICREAGV